MVTTHRVLALVIAVGLGATPAAADPARGAAVDLGALPALGAAGPAGPVQVHAADAHAGHLRNLLARVAKVNLIEAPVSGRVSGRLGPTNAKAVAAALAAGAVGGATRPIKPGGASPDVDLDFVGADRDDLLRLLGDVTRTSVVVAASGRQTLDLRVKRVRAGRVLDDVADRLGLVRSSHGGLVWLRTAGGPALDRALLATRGPRKVSVDVEGARAGEVYALLAAVGAKVGGAPCDAGAPVTFRVRDVPVGTALAVTAALSGQAPAAGTACAGDAPARDVRDLELRGIASIGPQRAAGFGARGGVLVAKRGATLGGATLREIGAGHVTFDVLVAGAAEAQRVSIQLQPFAPTVFDDLGPTDLDGRAAWLEATIARGRLAATVLEGAHGYALFELDGGRWTTITERDALALGPGALMIEPGKVRLRVDDPTHVDGRTVEAVLRKAP